MEIKIADCPLGAKCEEVKEENGTQVLYRCPWFVKVSGKDPQSEQMIDEWRCAIAWTPMLLIENAQQSRQTGAAIESFRNEVVKESQQNRLVQQVFEQRRLQNASRRD